MFNNKASKCPQTLILLALLSSMVAQPTSAQTGRLIFPLQEQHAHSSSIVECENGDLLVCWYRGSGERRADDVRIEGARSRDAGKSWSQPFVLADTPDFPDCNPILFVDSRQRLWLFWAQVVANRWETCLLKFRRAQRFNDEGSPTWDWQDVIVLKPGDHFPAAVENGFKKLNFDQDMWAEYAKPYDQLLVSAAGDPSKRQQGWIPRNHITTLPSGRWLLPLYSDGYNLSIVAISDDLGETWRASQPIVGLGCIQPSIVRRNNGQLVAFMRDGGGAPWRVQASTSDDQGVTWTAATDTVLPNPGSSMEVIRLRDGAWVACLNDTEEGRRRIAMALSTDEGKTWGKPKYIDRDPRGWYAYPSMLESKSGKIHVTYSYRISDGSGAGESIKHVAFDKSWLQPQ